MVYYQPAQGETPALILSSPRPVPGTVWQAPLLVRANWYRHADKATRRSRKETLYGYELQLGNQAAILFSITASKSGERFQPSIDYKILDTIRVDLDQRLLSFHYMELNDAQSRVELLAAAYLSAQMDRPIILAVKHVN